MTFTASSCDTKRLQFELVLLCIRVRGVAKRRTVVGEIHHQICRESSGPLTLSVIPRLASSSQAIVGYPKIMSITSLEVDKTFGFLQLF